jgi:hypothetical protein
MGAKFCKDSDTESDEETIRLVLDCGIPGLRSKKRSPTDRSWRVSERQPLHPQLPGCAPEGGSSEVMVPNTVGKVGAFGMVEEQLGWGTVPHAKLCEVAERTKPQHFTPTP